MPLNLDMWQRFVDCIICDQKSVPNAQGLLIQHSTRNILIGFNKTLQIWKFERTKHQIEQNNVVSNRKEKGQKQHFSGIFQGFRGQEKLPYFLRPDEEAYQISQRRKKLTAGNLAEKRSESKNPVISSQIVNGVKNYQWIKDELDPHLHKFFNVQESNPMLTFLSQPENQVRSQDSTKFLVSTDKRETFYQPARDELHPIDMQPISDYGTEYMSDFYLHAYEVRPCKR